MDQHEPHDRSPGHAHQHGAGHDGGHGGGHGAGHDGTHGAGHDAGHGDAHRRVLDLDAEVFGDQLGAALDLAGVIAPREVLDLGAGTGTGSRLLRARYPDAHLTSIDADPRMVDALRAQGFTAVIADLDAGLPAADPGRGAPDLVWTASALHHLTRPEHLLADVRRVLAADGVLVVVELVDQPRFLGATEHAALEERCHAAAAAGGWNRYPDWTPVLEAAGFTVSRSELTATGPDSPAAREHAALLLTRFLSLDGLAPEDRAALAALLPRLDQLPLTPRATRTAWIATPA